MPATVFRHLGFIFELNIDHVFKDSMLQWQQTDYNHTTVNKITSDNDTNEKFCEENTKWQYNRDYSGMIGECHSKKTFEQ